MNPFARLAWAFLALATSAVASACGLRADDSGQSILTIESVDVGIGNQAKAGHWTPVWLTVRAGASDARGDLELVTADGDQAPVIYGNQPHGQLQLAAGEERQVLLYAKLGPIAAPISVQLRRDGQVAWSQTLTGLPPRLAATQSLFVAAGPDVGLAEAIRAVKRSADEPPIAVHVEGPSGLPDRWWGYEGVDALVLSTSDAKFLDALTSQQHTALGEWVALGGRLVLCVGSRGEELFTGAGPWRELLPAMGVQVAPLRERSGLETLTGSELPWDAEVFRQNRPKVTRLSGLEGILVLNETTASSDRPLVVRVPRVFGQVIFVGLDLDHPGLAQWAGRGRLVAGLIERPAAGQFDQDAEAGRNVTHLGFTDLVGQLRAALDQFPGVTLVTFTAVSVLTVLFLLLIGPGDYLLLSWLKLPRHWTWGTFSLVVLAFGLIAWQLGADAHGSRLRINQVELVDMDAETGLVRGTVWSHIYSPAAEQLDVSLDVSPAQVDLADPAQGWLAWQGLPGGSLGGLSSRQVALATPDPYRVACPGAQMMASALPIETASSKSLSSRWWGLLSKPAGRGQPPATLQRTESGLLSGELTNPLPIDLSDAIVVYADRMYRVKSLKSGQTIRFEPYEGEFPALNLESRLTDRKPFQDKQVTTQWQHESLDIPRIMQIMMLHEAARGASYTGLTHRYQPYVDFSELALSERAVLIGRSAAPATQLRIAGHEVRAEDMRSFTWYRLVLPVRPPSGN